MKNKTRVYLTSANSRLKAIFTFLLLSAGMTEASAQKSLIINTLSKHNIDQSLLDPSNLRVPVDRAFDLRESTTNAGKTKVLEAKFEPSGAGREHWTVVSVDGKKPSLYETNMFRNTREKSPVDKPDETTYRIDSETADQLVISYKLDAASIPRDATFLKDCRAVLTVDLKSKQLTQLQLVNEKPVRIGPLTASKFEIVTKYDFDKLARRYLPLKDDLHMKAAFLGKTISTYIETIYSGYNKGR